MLNRYQCAYQVIVDRIVQLFDRTDEVDHDQMKVCNQLSLFTCLFNRCRVVFTFSVVIHLSFCLVDLRGQ